MVDSADLVTTEEAARTLGVSVQHVRRLADRGSLSRLARGLIDRDSLDRYVAERHGGRTRVWAEHTAWGAIALLTGDDALWLGTAQRSRLRAALRELEDPDELVTRTRSRAEVRIFRGHRAAVVRLRPRLAAPDLAALGLVPLGDQDDRLEGYLPTTELPAVVRSLGLRPDLAGNVVVRATTFDFDVVSDLSTRSIPLLALDAMTSMDPRTRGTGRRALERALNGFRR